MERNTIFTDIKVSGTEGAHHSQPSVRFGEGLGLRYMICSETEVVEEVREYYRQGSNQQINLLENCRRG